MKKRRERLGEHFFFQATAGVVCLWLYAGWSGRPLVLALAFGVLAGLIYWIVKSRQAKLQREADEARAAADQVRAALPKVFASIVRPNGADLSRTRARLLTKDANGTVVMGRWLGELSRFYQDEVVPELKHHFLGLGQPDLVLRLGDEAAFLDWFLKSDPLKDVDDERAHGQPEPDMSPADFERWCRDVLSRSGWIARVVSEGVPRHGTLLAERDDVTLALQCRLDSRPLGAIAVQEAVAARDRHLSQAAAIVSNQPYAPAVQALARQRDVMLLHFSELEDLAPSLLQSVASQSAPEAAAERDPAPRTNGPVPVFHRS